MTKQAELELCYQQGVQAAFEKAAYASIGMSMTGGVGGGMGAYEAAQRMQRAGMSDDQIDEVLSVPGGALRGAGKGLGYGFGGLVGGMGVGAGLGALSGDSETVKNLALVGAGLGSLAGAGYGTYTSYQDELERARIAILEREAAKKRR